MLDMRNSDRRREASEGGATAALTASPHWTSPVVAPTFRHGDHNPFQFAARSTAPG